MPFVFPVAKEDKEDTITDSARVAFHRVTLFAVQAGYVVFGLFYGMLVITMPIGGFEVAWILVFDDEAVVDGISPSLNETNLIAWLYVNPDRLAGLSDGGLERNAKLCFIGSIFSRR